MADYKTINKKLNKLKNQYEYDVAKFKKFSPIGNIKHEYTNIYINLPKNESDNNQINKNTKQLLKIIHPDKIKIIFGKDIPELFVCSQEIIQNNLNFREAIILLNKNTSKDILKYICEKIHLSDNDLNKIINTKYDKNIERHFDQEFIDLVKKYNEMHSKTLYNYINKQINTLFYNLNLQFTELIHKIKEILYLIDSFNVITENILMAREEFRLEYWLNNKEINISDLALFYPNSKFAKTFLLIKDNLLNIKLEGLIKIQRFMIYNLNLPKETYTECTKYLYNNFISI